MNRAKQLIIISVTILFCGEIKSQVSLTGLLKTWYESPNESSGDTTVFTITKYIPVPGVDNPAFEFSQITFSNNTDFSIKYWNWCKNAPVSNEGLWNASSAKNIVLDFGQQKCKNKLIIIDLKPDKLKVLIKE